MGTQRNRVEQLLSAVIFGVLTYSGENQLQTKMLPKLPICD